MSKLKHPASRGRQNKYYKYVHKLLNDWKIENNITTRCDVHHRDDTMECINYNNEHYNLWGCEVDENGNYSFTLGKYVLFMTCTEHMRYHRLNQSDAEREKRRSNALKGGNSSFFGKHHSAIARQKMSIARKGKSITDEHKKRIRESTQVKARLYEKYKLCGGTLLWNDFRRALANNEIDIDRL